MPWLQGKGQQGWNINGTFRKQFTKPTVQVILSLSICTTYGSCFTNFAMIERLIQGSHLDDEDSRLDEEELLWMAATESIWERHFFSTTPLPRESRFSLSSSLTTLISISFTGSGLPLSLFWPFSSLFLAPLSSSLDFGLSRSSWALSHEDRVEESLSSSKEGGDSV